MNILPILAITIFDIGLSVAHSISIDNAKDFELKDK